MSDKLSDERRGHLEFIERCDPAFLIMHLRNDTAFNADALESVFQLAKERARELLAASPAPAIPAGDWQPVETAPEGELVVVFWLDPNAAVELECYDFDMLEDGSWRQWTDHYEWAHSVAPVTEVPCTMPREHPPYTHWKRLGTPTEPAPAISESEDAVRWIATSDRLPSPAEDVLVAVEFFEPGDWRIKVGYFGEQNGWHVFGGSWTPTHWMPLPAAPIDAARKGEKS
ncbi:DUF551 domain-containing protein [Burkholderia gladioli]|uniref:DUF551 domain-containing protein n=1 Tax=Burkholderia gladioli TaxID=28095 RepID=UPI00163E7AAA|nr:DUF551 domain-containing protein [Burkholderia gladioli]